MWPWGHLAAAYLLYHAISHTRGQRITSLPLLILALASQLPDLIDKPLAWHLSLLPSGRSAAHSLIALTLILTLAYLLWKRGYRYGPTALAIGYSSHLATDALDLTISPHASIREASFLLYPLLSVPPDDPAFVAHPAPDPGNPAVWLQAILLATATLLYLHTRTRER